MIVGIAQFASGHGQASGKARRFGVAVLHKGADHGECAGKGEFPGGIPSDEASKAHCPGLVPGVDETAVGGHA